MEITPLTVSAKTTCARLEIGRSTFQKLVRDGRLKVLKLGSKILVPETEIARLLTELGAERDGGAKAAK